VGDTVGVLVGYTGGGMARVGLDVGCAVGKDVGFGVGESVGIFVG
jgi:hypothetical protein